MNMDAESGHIDSPKLVVRLEVDEKAAVSQQGESFVDRAQGHDGRCAQRR